MPKCKDTYYHETCTWINLADTIFTNIVLIFTIQLQSDITKLVSERTNW